MGNTVFVRCRWFLGLWLLALLVLPAKAHGADEEFNTKKISPVEIIFDHVSDSHEWHFFTIGHTHVSLPLPVIVYSRTRNELFCFMSSRFHHGTEVYKGFALAHDPENPGPAHIVEVGVPEGSPKPLDFSITKNVLAVFISCILLVLIFLSVAKQYKRNPNGVPKGLQNVVEPIVLFVRDNIAIPSIGEDRANRFMPALLTIFFFILINNLLGLIPLFPGGANLTGNITITMSLALFTFLVTITRANKHYWKHIVDTPGIPVFLKLPLPLMPIVEIAGMFTKPVVLMIRLFANMLAGHMIVLVFITLIFLFGELSQVAAYGISVVSVFFAIFMTLMDILVSFIQAYVFTMLSALYFGMATEESGH